MAGGNKPRTRSESRRSRSRSAERAADESTASPTMPALAPALPTVQEEPLGETFAPLLRPQLGPVSLRMPGFGLADLTRRNPGPSSVPDPPVSFSFGSFRPGSLGEFAATSTASVPACFPGLTSTLTTSMAYKPRVTITPGFVPTVPGSVPSTTATVTPSAVSAAVAAATAAVSARATQPRRSRSRSQARQPCTVTARPAEASRAERRTSRPRSPYSRSRSRSRSVRTVRAPSRSRSRSVRTARRSRSCSERRSRSRSVRQRRSRSRRSRSRRSASRRSHSRRSHSRRSRSRSYRHSRSRSFRRSRSRSRRSSRSARRTPARVESNNNMDTVRLLLQALGGRSNKRFQPYAGTSDYNLYRFRFLEHARQCGWDEPRQGVELSMLLQGEAEAVLKHLPDRERTNFGVLDNALKLRFAPSSNLIDAERRYAQLKQKPTQSLRQYAADVADVVMEMHQGLPSAAQQQLKIRAFVNGLHDSTIKRFVRRKRESYTTLSEALDQAERELAADERSGSPKCTRRVSVSPPPAKHSRTQLEELVRSVNAGNESLADLKARVENHLDPGRISYGPCYSCSEYGHYRRDCPYGRQQRGRRQSQGWPQGRQQQQQPRQQAMPQPAPQYYAVPVMAPNQYYAVPQQAPAQQATQQAAAQQLPTPQAGQGRHNQQGKSNNRQGQGQAKQQQQQPRQAAKQAGQPARGGTTERLPNPAALANQQQKN